MLQQHGIWCRCRDDHPYSLSLSKFGVPEAGLSGLSAGIFCSSNSPCLFSGMQRLESLNASSDFSLPMRQWNCWSALVLCGRNSARCSYKVWNRLNLSQIRCIRLRWPRALSNVLSPPRVHHLQWLVNPPGFHQTSFFAPYLEFSDLLAIRSFCNALHLNEHFENFQVLITPSKEKPFLYILPNRHEDLIKTRNTSAENSTFLSKPHFALQPCQIQISTPPCILPPPIKNTSSSTAAFSAHQLYCSDPGLFCADESHTERTSLQSIPRSLHA